MKKSLLTWMAVSAILTLLPITSVWAQGETCATAAPITVGTSCTATNFTMTTFANELASPAGCGTSNRDGWWTFTTGAGVTSITVTETTNRPIGLALYTGCAAGNLVSCTNIGSVNTSWVVTVTPSTTYYLRVYRTNTGTNAWTGSVCVFVTPPPPANNDCAGATSLTPGTTCVNTAGTTVSATQSQAAVTCAGFTGNADDDVWYSFVAASTTQTVTVSCSPTFDAVVQGFSGACGSLVSIGCADGFIEGNTEVMTLTGLTVGSTYRVRVYSFGAGVASAGTFNICVTNPPVNDNCAGAIALTMGATCSPITGSTSGASQSSAGCSGTADDDVWFSFVATATSHVVTVDGAASFDAVLQPYSGACGSLTSLGCIDNTIDDGIETVTLTGLTVGATYRVRVYDYYSGPAPTPNFTICVTEPPTPPANDNCANAVSLTVNAAGACGAGTPGTTAAATFAGGATPSCDPTGTFQDVWYSFNSGTNGTLNFNVTLGTAANVGIEFFTACGTVATGLTPGTCDFNASIPTPTQVSGFAPNTVYLFRIFTNVGFEAAGTFNVCISQPIPGDLACTAIPVTVGTTTNPTFMAASNVGMGSGSQGTGACSLGDFTEDVWFTATVPATGNIVVALDPSQTTLDLIGQIFTSSNNTCTGTLTAVACDDDGGASALPFMYAGGLTVGNTVFIRISNYDVGITGSFGIAVTDAVHWSGATSGVPTVATNWYGNPDAGTYPVATHDIRVLNVPNALAPTANFPVLDVYMNDGATVNNNGGNLRVNGDWHGGSQATPAIVTAPTDNNYLVLLSNNGTVDGYTNADRVRVNGTYAIASGTNHLRISKFLQAFSGVLTTNGNITFVSDVTGTAYLNNFGPSFAGSVSGNINMQRYNPLGPAGFRMLGTPVQLPNVSGISGFTPSGTAGFVIPVSTCDPNYVAYNSPYGNWMQFVENGSPQFSCSQSLFEVLTGGGMTNGRGYYLDVPGTSTLTFTGAANDGIVSYPLTHANTAVTNGWNMVANPFPSPLGWELVNVPVGVDAIAKIWQTSGAYLGTWQDLDPNAAGTQAVAIGQAFQVRVTVPGGTPAFLVDNTDRTTSPPTYLLAGGDPMTLNIDVQGAGFADMAKVRFMDGATLDMDAQFDSPKMLGNANQPMVYSVWGGKDYSTNTFATLGTVYSVPLGVKIGQSGSHNFLFSGMDQFPASAMIYLEDLENGTWQNLKLNDTYTFTQAEGIYNERFILHFYPPVQQATVAATCEAKGAVTLTEEAPADWDYVLKNDQNITVAQGQLAGAATIDNLPAGVYTLELTEQTSGYVAVETLTVTGATQVTAQAVASVVSVAVGDEIQFTGNIGNATVWNWNFGDMNTSTEQNPVHIYNAGGTYEVTLTAANSTCETVSVLSIAVAGGTSSVADDFAAAGVKMWNDNQTVYLNFAAPWAGKSVFTLYDVSGKKVFQKRLADANGVMSIDCGQLSAGTYTAELVGNGQRVSRKTVMGIK